MARKTYEEARPKTKAAPETHTQYNLHNMSGLSSCFTRFQTTGFTESVSAPKFVVLARVGSHIATTVKGNDVYRAYTPPPTTTPTQTL